MLTLSAKTLPRSFAALAALATLGACSTPLPPTITAAEFGTEQVAMGTYSSNSPTLIGEMPTTGTVNYTGRISSADYVGTGVSGIISMDVDFDASGMTGTISEVNYVENGQPDQTLGGTLALSGSVSGSGMSGTGSGQLSGVESGFTGRTNVNLTLDGQFRDDAGTADLITGTVDGTGRGDFDFDVDNGRFYASTD